MREIWFRAKSIDTSSMLSHTYGKWVYGWIMWISSKECCITNGFRYVVVDPDTVGQYTGLLDYNEEKIFEGDVYLPNPDDPTDVRVVTYCDDRNYPAFDLTPDLDSGYNELALMVQKKGKYKKLGNIHDNPGLVGERK